MVEGSQIYICGLLVLFSGDSMLNYSVCAYELYTDDSSILDPCCLVNMDKDRESSNYHLVWKYCMYSPANHCSTFSFCTVIDNFLLFFGWRNAIG